MTRLRNPSKDAAYYEGCVCVRETEAAILVEVPDLDGACWVPKSQIHDDSEVMMEDDEGVLAVNKWFEDKMEVSS
jgi:hypothetical protein